MSNDSGQNDHINRRITLSVITLSSFHCINVSEINPMFSNLLPGFKMNSNLSLALTLVSLLVVLIAVANGDVVSGSGSFQNSFGNQNNFGNQNSFGNQNFQAASPFKPRPLSNIPVCTSTSSCGTVRNDQFVQVLTPETRSAVRAYVQANSGPAQVPRHKDYGVASFYPRTMPKAVVERTL